MTAGSIRRAGGTQRIPAPHSRHDAGKPLWDNRSVEFFLDSLISTVADRAEPLGAISSPRPDERISSVLALLAPGPNGAEVLLTRRSSSLNNHSGEMSFPGGRVDEGESIIEAALRETHEEVGIDSSLITVHGRLSPLSTFVSRSYIVPIVASVEYKPELTLCDSEVERAVWVPLVELVRSDTFSWEWWSFSTAELSSNRPMFFFHLDDETVWGATARILHELLCVLHRVEVLELPNW